MSSNPETCAMCPKMCRFSCPVARATASDTVHPTGLGTAVVGAMRGTLPWEEAGRVVYECTMCLSCNAWCALDQDVPSYIRDARAEAVRRGVAPEGVMNAVEPDVGPAVWDAIKEAMQTDSPGETDVVYFPSCTALAQAPEIVMSVVSVLQGSGVGVRVVHPGCCGGSFGDLGHVEKAARMRAEAAEAVARARGRRVVTDSPLCARTLGASPFSVVAAELVRDGRLAPRPVGARAAYHDPCVLGRHLGVYEEPREVLGRVFGELLELPHRRERARCSGGGAGLPLTDPQASRAIAKERVDEARGVGAELIVSACPQCKVQFREAGFPVRDIAEVLTWTAT